YAGLCLRQVEPLDVSRQERRQRGEERSVGGDDCADEQEQAAHGREGTKEGLTKYSLCRRAALLAPWQRPQSRPYLRIWTLPASSPGNEHRTPATSGIPPNPPRARAGPARREQPPSPRTPRAPRHRLSCRI